MEKKYIMTNEASDVVCGKVLYRIQAIRDFNDVKKGDLGGWIEKEDNLSHEGNCWVYDNAIVRDNAVVSGNVCISGNVVVCGDVRVIDHIQISGDVFVSGNRSLCGVDWIHEQSQLSDNMVKQYTGPVAV